MESYQSKKERLPVLISFKLGDKVYAWCHLCHKYHIHPYDKRMKNSPVRFKALCDPRYSPLKEYRVGRTPSINGYPLSSPLKFEVINLFMQSYKHEEGKGIFTKYLKFCEKNNFTHISDSVKFHLAVDFFTEYKIKKRR